MNYFINKKNATEIKGTEVSSFPLLTAANGCVAGCCTGISIYTATEYTTPGVHQDQEGFVVMAGTGWAKIGDQEFPLEPETSFIAPAGQPHVIKREIDDEPAIAWIL